MAHALIVGAGIAGDTLAVLLERSGWRVTVAEIAPALRTGGQTVDLRGDSREVLERLGVLDDALSCLVPQRGIAWITSGGRRLADMPVEALGGKGFVSDEELLRTDLARTLHEASGPGVTHRFGETVDELVEGPSGVRVRFRSGVSETYDLVVGADGAHSRVRALHFGPEESYRRPLGLAHAWFTLREGPSTPRLDGWNLVHNAGGRRGLAARPGHPGEQEIGLTFAASSVPRGDREAQFALLDRTFAGAGWRAAEFLAAARVAGDFALDTYDQVHMPAWHAGRVVLLGDSAWCASPLSGLGTALALRGAAELADALARAGGADAVVARAGRVDAVVARPGGSDAVVTRTGGVDAVVARAGGSEAGPAGSLEAALAEFTAAMRPRVEAAQRLIPGRVDMVAPRSQLGVLTNALLMRVIQLPVMRGVVARVAADSGHAAA